MSSQGYFKRLNISKPRFVQQIINMRFATGQLESPVFNFFSTVDSDTSVKGFNFQCDGSSVELMNYRLILCDLISLCDIDEYLLLLPALDSSEQSDGDRYVTAVVYDGQVEEVFLFFIDENGQCQEEHVQYPKPNLGTLCSQLFDVSLLKQLPTKDQDIIRKLALTLKSTGVDGTH